MTGPDDGQLWIIDMVAPHGGVSEMVRSTKKWSDIHYQGQTAKHFLGVVEGQPYWTHLVQRHGALEVAMGGDPSGNDRDNDYRSPTLPDYMRPRTQPYTQQAPSRELCSTKRQTVGYERPVLPSGNGCY